MSLVADLDRLPELAITGRALSQQVTALHPNGRLVPEGKRWVYEPNFVTFTVQWQRAKSIVITLRGNPLEFALSPRLELKKDRPGYSICRVTSPARLAAAASYIERAHELYARGRARPTKRVVVREV